MPSKDDTGKKKPKKGKTTRYGLTLPISLWEKVETAAKERGTTRKEILLQFMQFGLLVASIEEKPDAALIIRQNGKDRELLIL